MLMSSPMAGWPLSLGAPVATTDAVAVGVTALATVLVVGLVAAALYQLKATRQMRHEAEALARECRQLLSQLGDTVRQAEHDIERVDRMVGSAEAISEAVGSASRLMGGVVAGPVIKVMAVASGVARGWRRLRSGPVPRTAPLGRQAKHGRRRRSRPPVQDARTPSRAKTRARARAKAG
jgi:hypothetical protein